MWPQERKAEDAFRSDCFERECQGAGAAGEVKPFVRGFSILMGKARKGHLKELRVVLSGCRLMFRFGNMGGLSTRASRTECFAPVAFEEQQREGVTQGPGRDG